MDAATTKTFAAQALNAVLPEVYSTLTGFAGRDDFESVIKQVFGTTYDGAAIEALRQQWLAGDFSALPQLEILPGEQLQGANAAYAGEKNTIYFSSDFLNQYAGNAEAVRSVFLEEIGHSVDWKINAVDTPGDEGELFAGLVQGITWSASKIEQMKQEMMLPF
ncbi:MAG: calcium-binding protein [Coleofasciculaceae cyanobacterium SM2_1_6]|nr:calcium-binding protein [Coleofasciculaceae cyanobacterium SM2_1_6]